MDLFEKLLDELEAWGAEPRQVLDDTFQGDNVFYLECLTKFTQDSNLQILRDSLIPEKTEVAIRAVHTIKGNADYLGLFPVMDSAMEILTALRAGRIADAISALPNLTAAFARLEDILTRYRIPEETRCE